MHYLIGHLVGDYLFQNDWQANNKTWATRRWLGLLVALFHGAIVTLSIYLCARLAVGSWDFWAWWKLLAIWLSHSVQDWTRAATLWMGWFKQFGYFKENLPQAYIWGMIVVDNTFHLLLLFVLANV